MSLLVSANSETKKQPWLNTKMISRKEQIMLEQVYDQMRKPSNEISNLESDRDTCLSHLNSALKLLKIIQDMDNPQQNIADTIWALENVISNVTKIN